MARSYSSDQSAPARSWVSVTPSDSTNLPQGCRGLWVGVSGTVALVGDDDVSVTFTIPNSGTVLPFGPKRVNTTGTTATSIVALY